MKRQPDGTYSMGFTFSNPISPETLPSIRANEESIKNNLLLHEVLKRVKSKAKRDNRGMLKDAEDRLNSPWHRKEAILEVLEKEV